MVIKCSLRYIDIDLSFIGLRMFSLLRHLKINILLLLSDYTILDITNRLNKLLCACCLLEHKIESLVTGKRV